MRKSKAGTHQSKRVERFTASWLLTKGAINALKKDKELVALPVISGVVSLLILLAGVAIFAAWHQSLLLFADNGSTVSLKTNGYIVFAVLTALVVAFSSVLSGALMHGALERFRGKDPTVGGSLRAAWKRAGALVGFGLFANAIGYVLSTIAERIPLLGGKIVAWLASMAWTVASFFAIPVIMDDEKSLNPVAATKKSIGLVKKTWGESLIVSFGIGLTAAIAYIVMTAIFGAVFAAALALSNGSVWVISIVAPLYLVTLFVSITIWTALDAFARAAIFYYAKTGESPVDFDARLMQEVFTVKKARKLFGR